MPGYSDHKILDAVTIASNSAATSCLYDTYDFYLPYYYDDGSRELDYHSFCFYRKVPKILITKNSGLVTMDVNGRSVSTSATSYTGPVYEELSSFSITTGKTYITKLNLPYVNITNIGFLSGCTSLTDLSFLSGKATTLVNAFYNTKIKVLDLNALDVSSCVSMSALNYRNTVCTTIKGRKLDVSNVVSFSSAFYNNSALTSLEIDWLCNATTTGYQYMFYGCSNLTVINATFDLSRATSTSYMFYNCSKLTKVTFANSNSTTLTNTLNMFYNCSKLNTINTLAIIDMGNVTNMNNMFYNCIALTLLPLIQVLVLGTSITRCVFVNIGKSVATVDFSTCGFTATFVLLYLIYSMYDRKTAGLSNGTLKLKSSSFQNNQLRSMLATIYGNLGWTLSYS